MDTNQSNIKIRVGFSEMIDLVSSKVGGKALFANDDFFASKDNLINPAAPQFIVDKYTENGKWMDGWESRRKRNPKRGQEQDHCVLQLGLPGEIHGVNIDTSFFTGNFPEYAALEACELPDSKPALTADLAADLAAIPWQAILPKSALAGGSHNYFPILSRDRWTHLRLKIFPDGGVARLRVHGRVRPSIEKLSGLIDVAAAASGGLVITANDMYFGSKDNLIFPGKALHMGEGWETRRKRGLSSKNLDFDWIIIKLAGMAQIQKIEVDTDHYKGNFPDRCSIDVLGYHSDYDRLLLPCDFLTSVFLMNAKWKEILAPTHLQAHHQHVFEKELTHQKAEIFTHLRLKIYPDGGVSRLRVWGTLK